MEQNQDALLFSRSSPSNTNDKISTKDNLFGNRKPETNVFKSTQVVNGATQSNALVELVDIFPTLAELAGLKVPQICPTNPFGVAFCTEGHSFAPLIMNSFKRRSDIMTWKNATFSQYPRPSDQPQNNSDLPNLEDIKIMGYSMTTHDARYTEWVGFNNTAFQPIWRDLHARELYIFSNDPLEDNNVADDPHYKGLVMKMSELLKKGWRNSLPQWT